MVIIFEKEMKRAIRFFSFFAFLYYWCLADIVHLLYDMIAFKSYLSHKHRLLNISQLVFC